MVGHGCGQCRRGHQRRLSRHSRSRRCHGRRRRVESQRRRRRRVWWRVAIAGSRRRSAHRWWAKKPTGSQHGAGVEEQLHLGTPGSARTLRVRASTLLGGRRDALPAELQPLLDAQVLLPRDPAWLQRTANTPKHTQTHTTSANCGRDERAAAAGKRTWRRLAAAANGEPPLTRQELHNLGSSWP